MSNTECATWKLEGALTLYTVETLRPQMMDRLSQRDGLEWDLGKVDACDCAGLQLLCSARKSAMASEISLQIVNPSPAIKTAADGLGLDLSEITKPPTPV
ncbi:MAG: hypothetical protein B9S32_03025 [Verrucomicrobia bacterium Tous-C9LFEB]|nr:MAG: hypothetical protein B9S32_03025 [Verrucomicrobia bacterium Tous-C9LFEB]